MIMNNDDKILLLITLLWGAVSFIFPLCLRIESYKSKKILTKGAK